MKIAIISDMHGNYPALLATLDHVDRWRPDIVVVNGDVVNRGPRSRDCWEVIRQRREEQGWLIVGGNHEDYVGQWLGASARVDEVLFQIYRSSFFTYRQLGEYVSELRDLPFQVEVTGPDGSLLRMTHGTMLGNNDGIYEDTNEETLLTQIAPAPDVFCTGHTHRPLVRRVNGTLVINSGSAGTAFDGDPRISYAQLTWHGGAWHGEIVRLDYDRARARQEFETSEFRQEGGPLVEIFLQEWLQARPMANVWIDKYEPDVIAGQISLEESVQAFLQSEGQQS